MRCISWIGVAVGGLADIVSTMVLQLPLLVAVLLASGNALAIVHDPDLLTTTLKSSPAYLVLMASGFCGSIIGGFVSARIAATDRVLNGALSAWLCIGGGLVTPIATHQYHLLTQELVAGPLSVLSGMIGGYLRVLQIRGAARRA